MKTSTILSRTYNDSEAEQDFRRTCALFENQKPKKRLKRAYQNYVNAYSKISTLYIFYWHNIQKAFLHFFDTENEIRKVYQLNTPKLTNFWFTTVLPNGELLCLAESKNLSMAFIVKSDFKVLVLKADKPWGSYHSAIYFNRNIYFFGGQTDYGLYLSGKYDLDANRWVKLAPVPMNSLRCSIIIFNGNILISGEWNNLVLYSIDIESFSTISYDFGESGIKLLINAERVYLIECRRNGLIYESGDGDIYSWKQIAKSIIDIYCQIYGVYNKGSIYIIGDKGMGYYKFDLSGKKMFKMPDKW